MSRDMIAQLKSMKNHPQTGWVDACDQKNARDQLMSAIGHNADRSIPQSHSSYLYWNMAQMAARPVGVFALLVVFLCGGWFTTAKAAANSLPGDMLYGVKIATEQVQLFITSDDRKAVLHTQFAQKRLSELQALQHSQGEQSGQYVIETVHALEAEVVKAGDALAQMKVSGDGQTLMVASVLDEKIGSIHAELEYVQGQDDVVETAQQTVDKVADSTVDTIVNSHESEETEQSTQALDRSFKNQYTSLRSRQEFDLGRVATIGSMIQEYDLEGIVTQDDLLHIEFIVEDATDQVGQAMGFVAAGGYRAAFDILREADEALFEIEAQLVEIETAIMEAMNEPEDIQEEISDDLVVPSESMDNAEDLPEQEEQEK